MTRTEVLRELDNTIESFERTLQDTEKQVDKAEAELRNILEKMEEDGGS